MTEKEQKKEETTKKSLDIDLLCEWTITAKDAETGEIVHQETRKESDS